MPADEMDETMGTDPVDHDADDGDRYSAVAVDHEETIIYDREIEEAWIQSDAVGPLAEWV
ncbi:hypothetical protein GCM10028857_06130 [Salinarchaeum chitinilyticum]